MINGLPGLQFRDVSFEDNLLPNVLDVNSTEYVEGDDNGNTFLDFGEEEFLWSYTLAIDETTTNVVMDMFGLYFDGEFIQELMASDSVEVIADPNRCASLGNFVWLDANGDGIQDADEAGINGIEVNLYTDPDMDGVADDFVSSTATFTNDGEDGYYDFTGLTPGKYVVEFLTPSDRELTVANADGDDSDATDSDTDSDVDPETGFSRTVILDEGENDPRIDAGIFDLLSLGNIVWSDDNNDGIFDAATEDPIADVVMALWVDMTGNGLPDMNTGRTTSTDEDGFYLFEGLAPGSYVVQVVPGNFTNGVLSDYETSTGNDPVTDPDDNVNNDDNGYDPGLDLGIISQAITLVSAGEPTDDGDADPNSNLTVDFGFFDDAVIGNYVWEDVNADGQQGPSALEPGINDVVVNLYDVNDPTTIIATTTTGENPDDASQQGYYLFDKLIPGEYFVEVVPPTGFIITEQDLGNNDALDSDVDETGRTPSSVLGAGDEDLTLDAGIYLSAKVGDYVWLDADGGIENIQDGSEEGVNGVTVNLYSTDDPTTALATQQTRPGPTGDGYYLFEGVRAGDYIVEFIAPSQFEFVAPNDPDGDDSNDSDVIDALTGRTIGFAVQAGDCLEDVDAGLRAMTLPVEFVSFNGHYNEAANQNDLYWTTASEINNDYFIVERSFEGEAFTEIARVKGSGTSLEVLDYDYSDKEVRRSGNYYYRLRQVDYDGAFEFSNTIVINIERKGTGTTRIFPNPAVGYFNIEVDIPASMDVKAFIIDATGKVVRDNIISGNLAEGVSEIRVPIDNLISGTYMVRIEAGGTVTNHKLLVLHR